MWIPKQMNSETADTCRKLHRPSLLWYNYLSSIAILFLLFAIGCEQEPKSMSLGPSQGIKTNSANSIHILTSPAEDSRGNIEASPSFNNTAKTESSAAPAEFERTINRILPAAGTNLANNTQTSSPSDFEKQALSNQSAEAPPRMVELGADKCIPCKRMTPILDELKKEYASMLVVEFIDVWKNPDVGERHKIKLIPTQIFYDAGGKELFRHEGFFSKENILAKWKELGFNFDKKQ
jgi:thioredoxin 1